MKTIVIIQARMGSTRLPGKVLLPLGDSCVLDYVVNRSKKISGVAEVIVATSTLPSDDPIVAWCEAHEARSFRGSEEDVLARYYYCALQHGADYVIRVTSDCPFVDFELASDIVEAMNKSHLDIGLLEGSLPRGLAVEMISFSALETIFNEGKEPRHREHVTYYAYEFPEHFSGTAVAVPENLRYPGLRITLDTEEDYALCKAVADAFPDRQDVSASDVVRYLLQNPDVAALNAHIEQKPVI